MADTTIIDIPFDPNVLPDDEDGDAANALPAEKDWHKEHLVSTKSAGPILPWVYAPQQLRSKGFCAQPVLCTASLACLRHAVQKVHGL